MNAAQAKKAGKVWANIKLSGGPTTPLLGSARLSSVGPLDPDKAFIIYMLLCNKSVKEAQAALQKAKRKKKSV